MPPTTKLPPKQRQARVTQDQRFRPYPVLSHPQSPDRQQRVVKTHMQDKYGVCNDDSIFHDLKCGHRIQAERNDTNCGANCVAPQYRRPFFCPQCTAGEVQVEMTLQGLSISVDKTKTTDHQQSSRDTEILAITNKKIAEARKRGERMCKTAEKFEDPTMQFFDNFLREEGFDGIDPSEAETTVDPDVFHLPALPASRYPLAPPANKKRKVTDFRPIPFRLFGESGTDYHGHGKIATPAHASSQLIPVHKRRKTLANKADPFQPRNQLKNPAWRDRAAVHANKQKQDENAGMANGGRASTMIGTGTSPLPTLSQSLTAIPTGTAPAPAPAHEDDATKAVRLAMAAIVLDERSGVDPI